jgi:hypothetical protein
MLLFISFFGPMVSLILILCLQKVNTFLLAISSFLLGFVCNKQKYEMITIKQLIEDILTKILEIEQVFPTFKKKYATF